MSQNATLATEFAPWHHFAQRWQCDSQKTRNTTGLKCCACHAKWHWRCSKCCTCHEKCDRVWKRRKSIAPATKNDFWHVLKHVGMSRSALPATRNEATRRWKPSKVTPFAELPIGTAIWSSRGRLRTAADGCGRKRNVRRTQLNPHTPRVKREPKCYYVGWKKGWTWAALVRRSWGRFGEKNNSSHIEVV